MEKEEIRSKILHLNFIFFELICKKTISHLKFSILQLILENSEQSRYWIKEKDLKKITFCLQFAISSII
jgi:hypothetical protein